MLPVQASCFTRSAMSFLLKDRIVTMTSHNYFSFCGRNKLRRRMGMIAVNDLKIARLNANNKNLLAGFENGPTIGPTVKAR